MYKRNLALAVWCAAALGLSMVVIALQPATPVRHEVDVVRHPSLAADEPVAVDIGNAHLGAGRRAHAAATGPIRMRGTSLVGVADDPRPMVLAQKPAFAKATRHAN
jgi:hypothetical protein